MPDLASILIDDSRAGGQTFLFENPVRVLVAETLDQISPLLTALDRATRQDGLHAAGILAYEAGFAFEDRLRNLPIGATPTPLAWFGLFHAPRTLTDAELHDWTQPPGSIEGFALDTDETAFTRQIGRIKDWLSAGDVYQINHTIRSTFTLKGAARGLYAAIRPGQRVGHGALIETDAFSVLSWSPELFLERQGPRLTTRPMKGTAPRGLTEASDRDAARALQADEKCRAENLMITDLLRNDLGRVAVPGSVRVDSLFDVEPYLRFNTLTSTVQADVADRAGLSDIMPVLFPCGSVTGAPKIHAMELIANLEDSPRGVYTGAVGHVAPGGDFSFNVAIRTAVIDHSGQGTFGVGAGIVADSNAAEEYRECQLKARFLTDPVPDFELFETTVLEPGKGLFLKDRHLARLEASCTYFGYPFDRAGIETALAAVPATQALRVRFAVGFEGGLSIEHRPLTDADRPARGQIGLAQTPRRSTDPFVFHKTSHRGLYGKAMADALAAGLLDLIFVNERGELTEGARTNLFIDRGTGLETPALACGLLPGTLRAELLASGKAREAILTPADLKAAKALFIGNSVMGLVPVELSQKVPA